MSDATPPPCRACPWRLANQGTRHPDGWYTKANLRRLWTAIRRTGVLNSCHPTDPGNTVSEKAQAAGVKPAPAGAQVRECTGAVILVSRELATIDELADVAAYKRLRPLGLAVSAAFALVMRIALPTNPVTGAHLPPAHIHDPAIGYEPLGAWSESTGYLETASS